MRRTWVPPLPGRPLVLSGFGASMICNLVSHTPELKGSRDTSSSILSLLGAAAASSALSALQTDLGGSRN